MKDLNNARIYLNSRSILDCENESDYERHTLETSNILDYLGKHAKAGAIVKVQHLDMARRDFAPTYMYVPTEDLYFNALNALDWKNGADFVADNGEIAVLVYGQNYNAYNYAEPFMEQSLVSYHFLNEDQIEHMNFIENSMEFIKNTDSSSLEQNFLSVIYDYDDFFINSDELVKDLLSLSNFSLDEKIHNAELRKEIEYRKDNVQISEPEK